MALQEYEAGRAFPGVIGRTTDESSPAWPRPPPAVAGASTVLWIVLDDTGYGQLSCYGSPIERLQHLHGWQVPPAALGVRVGGRPVRPLAARARLRALLRFLGGDTSQWHPDLVYDNHQVAPPRSPEEGYHLTAVLADKVIEFIADAEQVAPDKPFYLHFCTAATHASHHVPSEWTDRYAGQFDDGWDAYPERVFARQQELGIMPAGAELSRHDPDVPDWDFLSPDARRLAARMMEVFAGFLSTPTTRSAGCPTSCGRPASSTTR